ncbi:MAG: hypothetical protein KKF77_09995 [Proteobacteria bacterium]|nr:hypothetical protein [Pseudomonadota bacterium]
MLKAWRQRLRRIFSGLPGGSGGLTRSEETTFTLPDPDFLIRHLDIVAEATIQGQKGFPAAEAKTLDANEGKVKAHLEAAESVSWGNYKKRFEALDRELDVLPFRRQWSSPKEMAADFAGTLDNAVKNAEDSLRRLFFEMCDAYTELMAFREQNKLMGDARLNDKGMSYKLSVFAFCFLVEWLFNGYYLGQRLEGGFVAGLITAATFAAVNIALGAIIGRLCLPNMLHIMPRRKWLGGFGLGVVGVFVLGLNLGVGHMRTVLGIIEMDPLEAMRMAVQRLVSDTLNIGDMTSVGLVFVGLICAFGAIWGAFHWDEWYPGYAASARAFRKALNILEQTRRFENNRITRLCEDFRSELRGLRASVPAQEGKYQRVKANMNELQKDYKAHVEGLNGVLNTVMRHYRDLNRSARKGVPAPTYFEQEEKLSTFTPEDLTRYDTDKTQLDKMSAAVEQEAPDALERISTEQQNAQKRIASILPDHIEPSLSCKEKAGKHHADVENGGKAGDA